METVNEITVKNYEKALDDATAEQYIIDAIENSVVAYQFNKDGNAIVTEIHINDVSMRLASGYGSWKVEVALEINGTRKTFSKTHHNEDWYLSQKKAYDVSLCDSEEEHEEAIATFMGAFQSVIDRDADDIVYTIIDQIEATEE